MTSRRLLLVTPTFHDYWRSIASAFAELGYAVEVCRYDAFETAAAKVRNKLSFELPERVGLDRPAAVRALMTGRAVAAVRQVRPDVVLTVKGDQLDAPFWDAVDGAAARHVLWLYDELRRTRHTPASLARPEAIASYSALDAQALADSGRRAIHVPLAYDPAYEPRPAPRMPEVTFIGARYPGREATLSQLVEAGVAVRAYGRQWSSHPVDRLRTWQLARPAVPAGRDLDRVAAYTVMAASRATLNIHGDQDGFTMRTFEACGVGALQLLDRHDVEDLYEPGVELLTYAGVEELVDLCGRAAREPSWAQGIRDAGLKRTAAEHTFAHRAATLEALWA